MGLPAARLGDIGSGHSCHYPPSPAVEGSPNVIINGRPAVRKGDAYAVHGCSVCPAPPHSRKLAKGSPTVFFNGKQAGRIGDPIDCGGVDITGSPNVFIGASSPPGSRKPFREKCPYAHDAE
jgi:Uncharacterized conserved protein